MKASEEQYNRIIRTHERFLIQHSEHYVAIHHFNWTHRVLKETYAGGYSCATKNDSISTFDFQLAVQWLWDNME